MEKWSLKTQSRSWSTGMTYWVNCYLKIVFLKFKGLKSFPLTSYSRGKPTGKCERGAPSDLLGMGFLGYG